MSEEKEDFHDAYRAHERDNAWQLVMQESVIRFAEIAINSIIYITGGSVIAIAAFMGSIYSGEPEFARSFLPALMYLSLSASCACICAAASYLAQYCYAKHAQSVKYFWHYPYVRSTPDAYSWETRGAVIHIFAIGLAIIAFIFLFSGIYNVYLVVNI